MRNAKLLLMVLCLLAYHAVAQAQNTAQPQSAAQNPFSQLHFRHVGPVGNRAAAIVGEPGNPLVAYIGAASGGIWKTTDGGNRWQPVFDDQDVCAICALAIAPTQRQSFFARTDQFLLIRSFSPLCH